MSFRYSYLIPIAQGIWFLVGFILTYILSVESNDVPAVLPYVSDTGAYSTEGCIFSFTLCIGAILFAAIVYIKYLQVTEILKAETKFGKFVSILNKTGLIIATIGATSLIATGTFQVSRLFYAHILFAGIALGNAGLYALIQTYIGFKLYPTIGWKWMNCFRLLLNILFYISMAVVLIFGIISFGLFKGTVDEIVQWTPDKGGYEPHIISVAAEWVLVFCFIVYMASFTFDFKYLQMYKPHVKSQINQC